MHLFQLFYCALGRHVRSRGHAREEGGTFHSECRGCGKPMVRTAQGWVLEKRPSSEP